MRESKLIRKGAGEYERNIAGKKYKFLIKTEKLGGILVEMEPGAYSETYEHLKRMNTREKRSRLSYKENWSMR